MYALTLYMTIKSYGVIGAIIIMMIATAIVPEYNKEWNSQNDYNILLRVAFLRESGYCVCQMCWWLA